MLSVSLPVTHRADRTEPAATPPGRPRAASWHLWDPPRAVRLAAALLGLAAIATYLVTALMRLGYPFPLE